MLRVALEKHRRTFVSQAESSAAVSHFWRRRSSPVSFQVLHTRHHTTTRWPHMAGQGRPTFTPARGSSTQGGNRFVAPSHAYSSRDLPAHKTLKVR
jgi:hypothetical protein